MSKRFWLGRNRYPRVTPVNVWLQNPDRLVSIAATGGSGCGDAPGHSCTILHKHCSRAAGNTYQDHRKRRLRAASHSLCLLSYQYLHNKSLIATLSCILHLAECLAAVSLELPFPISVNWHPRYGNIRQYRRSNPLIPISKAMKLPP